MGNGRVPKSQVEMGERGSSDDAESDWYAHGQYVPEGDPLSARRPTAADFTRMIERDGMGQALDYALTLPLRQGLPYVEPHPQDKGEAEYIRRVMFESASEGGMTTPISDVIAQMTSGVTHRFAPFEMVLKSEGSEILLHKLAFRPQKKITIVRDKNGSFNGYKEKGERQVNEFGIGRPYEEKFDPDKTFVYFHGGNRKPSYGESALEAPYRHHVEKLKIMKLSNEHLANHALGVWVGTHAPRATDKARKAFFAALSRLRGGGRMLKGPDEKIEALNQGSANEDFRSEKAYHDAQMCLACLVQFLLLSLSTGPTGTGIGSNALSTDQTDFFTMSQESRRYEMALALTNHVAAKLVKWNFPNPKYPEIRYLPLSDSERRLALDVWKTLVTSTVRRTGELEFNAIQERALQALGIDIKELQEQAGEDAEDDTADDVPPAGDEDFQQSLQNLLRGMGTGGTTGATTGTAAPTDAQVPA